MALDAEISDLDTGATTEQRESGAAEPDAGVPDTSAPVDAPAEGATADAAFDARPIDRDTGQADATRGEDAGDGSADARRGNDAESGAAPNTRPWENHPLLQYRPRSPFAPGRGRSSTDPFGTDYQFEPCAAATTTPRHAQNLAIAVDGNGNDWLGSGLVAVDREGNGIDDNPGLDIVALGFAEDAQSIYFGVQMAGDWPVGPGTGDARLVFEIQGLSESSTGAPFDNKTHQWIFTLGNGYFAWDRTNFGGTVDIVQPNQGAGAIRGSFAEVSVRKSVLANLPATYSVNAFILDTTGGRDRRTGVGTYVVGYDSPGACLVPLPDGGFTLHTFYRSPGVSTSTAEDLSRLVIAAVPETVHALGLNHGCAYQDTHATVLVDEMVIAGYFGVGSLFIRGDVASWLPRFKFGLMAHEYAHCINVLDYETRARWSGEGHSELARILAIESFFGEAARDGHLDYLRSQFAKLEPTGSAPQPLSVEPWPMFGADGDYPSYAKAAWLVYGLWKLLGSDAIAEAYDFVRAGAPLPYSGTDLMARLDSALAILGIVNSWSGWILPGAYDNPAVSPPE